MIHDLDYHHSLARCYSHPHQAGRWPGCYFVLSSQYEHGSKNCPLASHPLGPLATLAALAQEWRTRGGGLGTTWAGLWHPTQQSDILAAVAQHAQRMDVVTLKRLARRGALPGVRDYSLLWALL